MSAEIKRRFIARSGWGRILRSRSAYRELASDAFTGIAGLLRFDEVKAPLTKNSIPGAAVKIVDDGYSWLQLAPKDAHWWLTVMFDGTGVIVQYYFDVTKENVLLGCCSYFLDMFLDIVALPDGRSVTLDRDELDEAAAEGLITAEEHAIALETADMLSSGLPRQLDRLGDFCTDLYVKMTPELKIVS